MLERIDSAPHINKAVELRAPANPIPAAPIPTNPAPATTPAIAHELRALLVELSSAPPVDGAKVARLRAAIEAGNYELSPQKIADAMLRSETGRIPG